MHLREAAAHGLNYACELIDLETLSAGPEILPQLFDDAERRGFTGLNITHPCKQIAIPLLDELSEEAATIGAVNTVLFKNGKRIGHNTDWQGFAEAFRRVFADIGSAVPGRTFEDTAAITCQTGKRSPMRRSSVTKAATGAPQIFEIEAFGDKGGLMWQQQQSQLLDFRPPW